MTVHLHRARPSKLQVAAAGESSLMFAESRLHQPFTAPPPDTGASGGWCVCLAVDEIPTAVWSTGAGGIVDERPGGSTGGGHHRRRLPLMFTSMKPLEADSPLAAG